MRFLDSNVFVHAYIKPKRALKEHERRIKEGARAIVARVDRGEEVLTTTVHVGEIANLLEDFMSLEAAREATASILLKESIHISEVGEKDYILALPVAEESAIGLNDALAYTLMLRKGMEEIYSFDRDFDKLEGIRRIQD